MSRRHHHHNIQPYDYERFSSTHSRDREQARAIEYQDDSLSSINSDEESYLHNPHVKKEKKGNFFSSKTESTSKPNKSEKSSNTECYHQKSSNNESYHQKSSNNDSYHQKSSNNDAYHQKEAKSQTHAVSNPDHSTGERLGRLEALLEELVKRNNPPAQPVIPPAPSVPVKFVEKVTKEKNEGQYCLVPRRHDFTTSMWINKIEEMSLQNNWSEKSTIRYMGTQMSGIVKAWYNSLPNYDFTWPEWKILISKIFPDNTDFVTTLKRLVTRLKQADESITTYYFSKMYLIEACKITGEDAVSCLIDGLNNQAIQEQAKAQNYLTPETLYSQFLMTLPDYSVDYAPSSAPTTTETVLNNWYYQEQESNVDHNPEVAIPQEEFVEYERDPITEDVDYRNQEGNPAFHGNDEEAQGSIKTPLKRAGTVHSRLDKRFIRTNNFRHHNKLPMAAKVCSICLNRGHMARNCRNADNILYCKLTSNTMKNCFYKECIVNNQKFDAFVDTGCSTVTIQHQAASKLDLILTPTTDQIQVYGGGYVQVLGETEVALEVDSVKAFVRAVVVPDNVQNVSVIIGQAFLTQRNLAMFLQNETFKISEAPIN